MNEDNSIKVKSITLVITHQCNLRCVYCYEKHKDKSTMSFETAISIIEKELLLDDGIERIEFDFFGGEPLLEFDLIKQIVEYFKVRKYDKSYIFFITTNGVLLNKDRKEWLKNNTDYLQMALSLDGNKLMHDLNRNNSFDLIDIDFFKETYPLQGIKMTISNLTLPYLADGVIFAEQYNLDISCNLAYGIDWSDKNNETIYMRELHKLINHYLAHPEIKPCALLDIKRLKPLTSTDSRALRHCGAGWAMKSYDFDGTFYPCQHFLPISIGKEKALESLKIDFKDSVKDVSNFNKKCRECILKNVCPTCYGENFSSTGDINKRDMSLCNMFKIQFKALAFFASELYKKNKLENLSTNDRGLILKSIIEIDKNLKI